MSAVFNPLGYSSSRAADLMRTHQLDGLLLTSPECVYYSTGYPCLPSSGNPILYALRNVLPFYSYIDSNGEVTLFCWGGAVTGVTYGVKAVVPFADHHEAAHQLATFLYGKSPAIKRLGIENTCPWEVIQLCRSELQPVVLTSADACLTELRMIKSKAEIECLKQSTHIVEQVVADLLNMTQPGVTRPYLIREAKTRMLQYGASGIGHITLSFGTSNPEVEIDEVLKENRLVVLDCGAQVQGYASDNRRLCYTGRIPKEMIDLHRSMCQIVDDVAEKMRPGVSFGALHAYSLQYYQKAGLKPFIPNIGHTIGLNTEEIWIAKSDPTTVQPGMVINLEMYALYSSGELIGDEETYIIEENGAVQLTTLPREIRSVTS